MADALLGLWLRVGRLTREEVAMAPSVDEIMGGLQASVPAETCDAGSSCVT